MPFQKKMDPTYYRSVRFIIFSAMKESFLHHIWKYRKFSTPRLQTTSGEIITLVQMGQHNTNSGPDFFNAQLGIDGQLWAGNVEIHVKSSDWYAHNHENDLAYDNVILHVVYEHDVEVFRKDNSKIPTLELKKYIDLAVLQNYKSLLFGKSKWINCENEFANTDDFLLHNWLERLYFERLERKSKNIESMLLSSKNDWEAVLFKLLAKNFGLKVNGEAFLDMASSFDFSIVRKLQSNLQQLEALFFGQSCMLDESIESAYYQYVSKEYMFLRQKFGLSNKQVSSPQFFRLRPPNFPTIRLAQLAMLYHKEHHLFSKIIESSSIDDLYKLLKISTSAYWTDHYTFGKKSRPTKKILTESFMDLLIINTLLPLKFSYAKYQGKNIDEDVLNIIQDIGPEKNSIVDKFNGFKYLSVSALQSQALIQLKTEYCAKNKCLQCAIGNSLLKT